MLHSVECESFAERDCVSTHSNALCEAWVGDAVDDHSGAEAPQG